MSESNELLASLHVDRLLVLVFSSRQAMGDAAARAVAGHMRARLAAARRIAMIFAAAPSQDEFLAALAAQRDLDWPRVTAFQMDDYVGLSPDAPQNFGRFLRERLFDAVRPGVVQRMDSTGDPAAEIVRYGRLVHDSPPDITCAGIGETGHLAFNDPPLARFDDPEPVRVVRLAEQSRAQQVHDRCFATLDLVPTLALTLTIPVLIAAPYFSCVVPGALKAEAVRQMLLGPIALECPASILRRHANAVLYLDRDAAGRIPEIMP
jgi:glucosamine-6-phosphate deaminase